MSKNRNLPLSELLRPKTLQDLALPEAYISGMQTMLDNQSPDNMLFFGLPGTGKTSAADVKNFLASVGAQEIELAVGIEVGHGNGGCG